MEKYHRKIFHAASSKFGIRSEGTQITHFSEHSLVGSFEREGAKYFLRVTNNSHKQFEKIIGEVQWINFLNDKGLRISRPVHSADGNLAEQLIVDDNCFTVVCFEEALGRPVREGDQNETLFKRMGMFMGKMHSITKQYIHEDPITRRPDWSVETEKVLGIDLPTSEKDIIRRYVALLEYLSKLPYSVDSYGLIHADFHYGNFYIDGDSICLFDFDACRYSWFIDDIAVALFHASPFESLSSYTDIFLPSFMQGYSAENNLEEVWLKEIPYFIKLREIGRYIKLFNACGGKIEELHLWGREFMKDRKESIMQSFPVV
ncbi:aminoglycoside phosphotransferase [Bacillus sp. SA1-12]|uniref:phosphotransferase enzyme family protein n=1 Tax=Bacillus sp. SA1-12 TaxID=1455638 RepID=UPI00062712FE|nr:phosphotransferase [Bacillus sp. SA1-12]KKI88451.1 aminoglycoside phosphotransferase [Bacillus sp. SA1-12]